MTQWRLIHIPTSEEQDNVINFILKDTFNRFARECVVEIYDPQTLIPAKYPKGTRIELQYKPTGETAYISRFGGFVVDFKVDSNSTILSILSHDIWLRKRIVFKNYENEYLSDIIEDLITTLTPIDYDPSLITIVNDIQISRRWQGEPLDEVLLEISSISGFEEFGATDDRRFYFRPQQVQSAPYNYTEGNYSHTEFERSTRQEINKVTIYYDRDENRRAVSVQDLVAQQEYADKIGSDDPVVLERVRAYPEITDEDSAIRKAERILKGDESVLIGTVHTWGSEGHKPGDIVRVIDPDVGINENFRIAYIKYDINGNVEVRLAENVDEVVDILISLNEEKTRIDVRDVDVEVSPTEVIDLSLNYKIKATVNIYKLTTPDDAFIWGELFGGWGDPEIGGGLWGDNRTVTLISNIQPGGTII